MESKKPKTFYIVTIHKEQKTQAFFFNVLLAYIYIKIYMLFILIFAELNHCIGLIEIKFSLQMSMLTYIKTTVFSFPSKDVEFWIYYFIYLQENVSKAKAMIVSLTHADFLSVENAEEFSSRAETFLEKLIDQLM